MTGYVDLQLNGYFGVEFNDSGLTAERFHFACERLREHGVRAFLPTLNSVPHDEMVARLTCLSRHIAADPLARAMAAGIHIETPFLNPAPGYRGATPPELIQPPSLEVMRRYVDAGNGLVRLVTLAPECDPGFATIRWLAAQGIRVAAGHCDPTLDQLRGAVDAGVTLFAHLGNGMPMQVHRHDNVIQRVLSLRDRITPCFIADGVHVPLFALRNYLDLAGTDRAVVVTDAIHIAGLGPGRYRLRYGREADVGEDLAVWAPDRSHLCGSAVTMAQNEANLRKLGYDERQIRQMTCENPARAAGL